MIDKEKIVGIDTSITLEGVFGYPQWEEIEVFPPTQKKFIARAFIRFTSGQPRVMADCIHGGYVVNNLNTIELDLDGRKRFVGPCVSNRRPDDSRFLLAKADFGTGPVYLIEGGKVEGRYGIWDTRLNPLGSIDLVDKLKLEKTSDFLESISEFEKQVEFLEQNKRFLKQDIRFLEQDISFSKQELDKARAQADQLKQRLDFIKNEPLSSYDKAILILGLSETEFKNLPTPEQVILIKAIRSSTYRALHPDRFREQSLSRNLRHVAEEALKETIWAINVITGRFNLKV